MNKREIKLVDLKPYYLLNKVAIDRQMEEVINSTSFIMGKQIDELEKILGEFVGVDHAIGVGSGTDALLVSLLAAGIGKGDSVITSPFSFIATAEAIAILGAKPVFVDIEPSTFNIDVDKLEDAIKKVPGVKAICPVSLYGQPADMDAIMALADKSGILVIEDGCQSFGAELGGKKSCGVCHIGVTSFFPAKPFGCFGDGGMVFTDDKELATKIRSIRVHGQGDRYQHRYLGMNARLDTLQAAVLLGKFPSFIDEIKKRREKAEIYSSRLGNYVKIPFEKPGRKSVYGQYTVRVRKRDEVREKLSAVGVHTAVHYPTPIHLQPPFRIFGSEPGDFPESEKAATEVLSLPLYPYLSDSDQDYVIVSLIEAVQQINS